LYLNKSNSEGLIL